MATAAVHTMSAGVAGSPDTAILDAINVAMTDRPARAFRGRSRLASCMARASVASRPRRRAAPAPARSFSSVISVSDGGDALRRLADRAPAASASRGGRAAPAAAAGPPTACQPKKRLTRSRMIRDRCWISIAVGPSTRSTSVPGCWSSLPIGARPLDLLGLAMGGDLRPDDLRPAGDQLGRGKALLGEGVLEGLAQEVGQRPRLRFQACPVPRLVHARAALPCRIAMTVAATSDSAEARRAAKRSAAAATCSPGTTAIAACCRGAPGRARRPIPTGSGSPRSCCSRPP